MVKSRFRKFEIYYFFVIPKIMVLENLNFHQKMYVKLINFVNCELYFNVGEKKV